MYTKPRELLILFLLALSFFFAGWAWRVLAPLPLSLYLVSVALLIVLMAFVELSRRLFQRIKKEQWQHYRQLESLQGLYYLLKPEADLPPMRDWAASPDYGLQIAHTILAKKPKRVLELGSGTSSLITAYCLRKIGEGELISLDHKHDFLLQSKELLKRHGLEALATFHHCPLKEKTLKGHTYKWYDTGKLKIPQLDCCIVDGPPRDAGRHARYPALELLKDKMSEEGIILVDDANRGDMPGVIRRWQEEEPGLQFSFMDTEKGLCLISGFSRKA